MRVFRRLGLVVAMVLLASLGAMPVAAGGPVSPGGGPIASGAVQTGNGFQVQFVIFENGGGVVNYAFTGGLGLIGGFEPECVHQAGNKVWALGPETHHAGQFGGPWEGSEWTMLLIEDNAGLGKPDLRDIQFSATGEFTADEAEAFCTNPALMANRVIEVNDNHTVVYGDIRIRP